MSPKKFYKAMRVMHGGSLSSEQVAGYTAVMYACQKLDVTNPAQISYILATVYHETGRTFAPIRETCFSKKSRSRTDATVSRIIGKHFRHRRRNRYWLKDSKTGQYYFGRGYVQLTHKYNYKKLGKYLNLPLVMKPRLAMEPTTAALILVAGMKEGMFSGKRIKLSLVRRGTRQEFIKARYLVNGRDHAAGIAKTALRYNSKLRSFNMAAFVGDRLVSQIKAPVVPPNVVEQPAPVSTFDDDVSKPSHLSETIGSIRWMLAATVISVPVVWLTGGLVPGLVALGATVVSAYYAVKGIEARKNAIQTVTD